MAVSEYTYTGGVQNFVVPDQCTEVYIQCIGAGSTDHRYAKLSTGGSGEGTLATTPGETLYIYVGGEGAKPGTGNRAGGFNGGGTGGAGPSGNGGGGGGASDVRQGGTSLLNRKVVGGGAGGYHIIEGGADSTHGGHGGGTAGEDGNGSTAAGSGTGGTQTSGGISGTGGQAGGLGYGGSSSYLGSSSFPYGPGGGGGGYYGGGSGFPASGQIGLAGGGGSSYIGGVTGGLLLDGYFYNGSAGEFAGANPGTVVLSYNLPPGKPTVPALPSNFRVDQPLPLTFIHNDEPGDTMTQANVRWRPSTVSSWVELDNVTVTGDASGYTYTFPANFAASYVGTLIDFQVQTVDSHGAVGPWSDTVTSTPTTATSSSDVVITAPAQLYSQTPSFVFALSTGDNFYGGKVQCWTDSGGSPGTEVCEIIFTQSAAASVNFIWDTSNEIPGTYDVSNPSFQFTDGQSYHFLVALEPTPSVYSDPADSGPLLTSINSPQAASIVAFPLPSSLPPAIRLEITNFSGYDPYPASYNDLYRTDLSGDSTERIRIAHGIPLNGSYTDYLPGLSVQYQYDVVPIHVSS